MNNDSTLLNVQYKFKGEKNYITVSITEKQYVNLLELPIVEECDILGTTNHKISDEEKAKFNERIKIACKENEMTHTKYLLQ